MSRPFQDVNLWQFYTFIPGLMGLLLMTGPAGAQNREAEADLVAAGDVIAGAGAGDHLDRVMAGTMALDLMERHAATDENIAAVAGMLDLTLDVEGFKGDPLEPYLDELATTGSDDAWREFQDALDQRVNHLLKGVADDNLSAEDAESLLKIAEAALWAAEDGDRAALLETVELLKGIAERIADNDNEQLLDAFREAVAELASAPAVRPFRIPAAITVGIVDHNRRGLGEITRTLEFLPAAMDGDPAALRGMIEGSRRVEELLTGQGYLRSIWDAFNDSMVDDVPGSEQLAEWFGSRVSEENLALWVGDWTSTWNDVRIHPDGTIEPIGSGLFSRRGGRIFLQYATEDTLIGTWDFRVVGIEGTFEWTLTDDWLHF